MKRRRPALNKRASVASKPPTKGSRRVPVYQDASALNPEQGSEQGSLFGPGVDLGAPRREPPPVRKRKRQAPLRTCPSCGAKYRSWSKDRYCGSARCVEIRLYGPAGPPPEGWEQTWTPEQSVPYNEFPPGF